MGEQTSADIRIHATPERVLDVIAELEDYPSWARDVSAVRVEEVDDLGWPTRAEFVVASGPLKDTYALDYDWDVDEDGTGVVSWSLARSRALRTMDGAYTLAADGDGTHLTYRLAVELLVPVPRALRRKAEETVVRTALESLREAAEGR